MERQTNIEIFLRDTTLPRLLAWAEARVGPLEWAQEAGASTVYPAACGPVVVTPSMEDGPFIGIWFNSASTPWDTDVDCARDAARELGCTVRCDPGRHYPEIAPQSSVFMEILGDHEQLICWE